MNVPQADLSTASRTHGIIWAIGALLCAGVALVSYRYLLGVGAVAPVITANPLKDPWLTVHVAGAATALLIGPVQLLRFVRDRFHSLHRWMGRTYVVACLTAGVGGFMLALRL